MRERGKEKEKEEKGERELIRLQVM